MVQDSWNLKYANDIIFLCSVRQIKIMLSVRNRKHHGTVKMEDGHP